MEFDFPRVDPYSMYVTESMFAQTVVSGPLTGREAAEQAWRLSDATIQSVIPPGAPAQVLADIRRQFAAWCSSRSRSSFRDLSVAWNEFVVPRPPMPRAILLPGSPCSACTERRMREEQFDRLGYPDCKACLGSGRLRPRQIPSREARPESFLPEPPIERVYEEIPPLGTVAGTLVAS